MSKKRLEAYALLIITIAIWGAAGPVIKFTLFEFPPLIFLTYRFVLSSIIGLIFLSTHGIGKTTHKPTLLLLILLCAFLTSTVRLGSLFFGFNETSSFEGTVISAVTPIFMALTGHFVLAEKITRAERVGMLLAVIGTFISVAAPVFAAEPGIIRPSFRGNFIILLSMGIDVIAVLLMKIVVKKAISPSLLAHVIFIVGLVTMLPIALFFHSWQELTQTILHASLSAHLGVWYMALISGTVAYMLHGQALKRIEMGEAGMFAYLMPMFAAPLSFLWLKETVSPLFIFGSIIIAIGVAIAELHRRKAHR
ncbi:DMT family transporter [Candidatus Microgenomates bacterium]|nr:MAG: DMT family transporter [Candidatus Microgenomates bacterium]